MSVRKKNQILHSVNYQIGKKIMSLNINRWRVELSENDTESDLDYEDFDNSLFSSSAIR